MFYPSPLGTAVHLLTGIGRHTHVVPVRGTAVLHTDLGLSTGVPSVVYWGGMIKSFFPVNVVGPPLHLAVTLLRAWVVTSVDCPFSTCTLGASAR